jgi:hypothetical protein
MTQLAGAGGQKSGPVTAAILKRPWLKAMVVVPGFELGFPPGLTSP